MRLVRRKGKEEDRNGLEHKGRGRLCRDEETGKQKGKKEKRERKGNETLKKQNVEMNDQLNERE